MGKIELDQERYRRGEVSRGNNFRLKRFIDKLRSGREVAYGAIGGSITEGACASLPERRYVNRFASTLTEHFPGGKVHIVNAGIGASNSLFGTFRADKDLLRHQADLITIEYAVNDTTNPETEIAFESLVRKCLARSEDTAVVLLFTMNYKGDNAQHLHSRVGSHYQIPMLSYRDAIYPDVVSGHIMWNDIAPDIVHPNDLGHSLIGNMLEKLLVETDAAPPMSASSLPDYLNRSADKYEHVKIIDASEMDVVSQSGWRAGPHKAGYAGWQTDRQDAAMEIRFNGRYVAAGFQQYSGDFGRASASLDGLPPVLLEGYFQKFPDIDWAGGHTVIQIIGDELAPGNHLLKINMREDRHPNSSGHDFDLGYLLVGE